MARIIHDPADIDFDRPGKHHYEVAFTFDGTYDKVLVPLRPAGASRRSTGGT